MNVQEALEQYAEYPPMTIRDLKGVVQEKIIQIDVLQLASDFEKALRAAYDCGFRDRCVDDLCDNENGVTTGITEMTEKS